MRQSLKILYKDIDTFTQRRLNDHRRKHGQAPSCKKGCNACCTLPVAATFIEAIEIVDFLIATGQDVEKIQIEMMKDLQLMFDSNLGNWFQNVNRPCALLKNGLCSVYKRRPISCRVFYVFSDPKLCGRPGTALMTSAIRDWQRTNNGELAKRLIDENYKHAGTIAMGPLQVMVLLAMHMKTVGPLQFIEDVKGTIYQDAQQIFEFWKGYMSDLSGNQM